MNNKGQGLVEYALILVLVAIVIIVILAIGKENGLNPGTGNPKANDSVISRNLENTEIFSQIERCVNSHTTIPYNNVKYEVQIDEALIVKCLYDNGLGLYDLNRESLIPFNN